jgi:hemerythrin superfamily protein
MKATELLKKQHREVKSLFRKAKKAESSERREILDEIAAKLTHHMNIEETIFYPAVNELGTKKTNELVPEAYEEHHVVTLVLSEFPNLDPDDERFEAKMTVLDELIEHHVEEEEKEMFPAAEKLGAERLNELGAEMAAVPPGGIGGDEPEDADETDDEDEDEDEVHAEGDEEGEEADDEDAEETAAPPKARSGTRRSA